MEFIWFIFFFVDSLYPQVSFLVCFYISFQLVISAVFPKDLALAWGIFQSGSMIPSKENANISFLVDAVATPTTFIPRVTVRKRAQVIKKKSGGNMFM